MSNPPGNQRELRRGSLELGILHLLIEQDRYGYELATALADRTSGFLAVKEGTLYPVLYRLEENRWVEIYWETLDRGQPRKYYRITDAGREAYQALRRDWENHVVKMQALLGGKNDV